MDLMFRGLKKGTLVRLWIRDKLDEIKKSEEFQQWLKSKKWKIMEQPCFGCEYAIYSEEGFIDACDLPSDKECPRGYKFKERDS